MFGIWGIGIIAAAVGGGVWLVRWLLKWRDPSWDSREGQSKSKLWSKNSGGGAPG
ncbi:MAG TPA: hypothetical protein VHN37_10590 [Actinomycetota bacterium]|nr:hypothetical protein [Actinomycetota bacterium]